MKRKPLLLALALLAIISAAIWGVNYRLDHPPLSQADQEFRALVAGANSVELSQTDYRQMRIGTEYPSVTTHLNAAQTGQLIEQIRFSDAPPNNLRQNKWPITLIFKRAGQPLALFVLDQTARSSQLLTPMKTDGTGASRGAIAALSAGFTVHQIHPRFEKRLNRTLDAYLPQRIRP